MRGLLIAFLLSAAPGASILFATARNEVVVDIRSNSEVLSSGSALSEESRRLKADMEAMRLQSEAMRRQLDRMGPARAAGRTIGGPAAGPAAPSPSDLPDVEDSRQRWLPWLVLLGLIFLAYLADRILPQGLGRRRRPIVICPGCGKRLRVPRSRKRVRIRCPSCRRESAYNPQKKPKKR